MAMSPTNDAMDGTSPAQEMMNGMSMMDLKAGFMKSDQGKRLQQLQTEAIELQLWASAQGLALAKLKIFHSMARKINDQE